MRPGSLMVIAACAVLLGGVACVSSDVSRELGARCEVTNDCDERCLVPSTEFPDGFCTQSCINDDECPGRAFCVDNAGQGGICLFGCRVEEGCEFLGEGWSCQLQSSEGADGEVMVCIGN